MQPKEWQSTSWQNRAHCRRLLPSIICRTHQAVQSVRALLTLCLCTTPRVIFASFCCTKTCYGCHTNHNEAPVGELGLLSSSASSSSVAGRRAWPRSGGAIACPSIHWLQGWRWPGHRRLLIGASNHNEAPVGELRLMSSSS